MVENVQSMFSTRTEKLTQRAESLVKLANKNLNNLRSRLARVAGGSDDGSSWKAGIEGEAAKGSPEFQTATLQTLRHKILLMPAQLRRTHNRPSLALPASGSRELAWKFALNKINKLKP